MVAKEGKMAQARPRLVPKRQRRSMAAVVERPRWGMNQRRVGAERRKEEETCVLVEPPWQARGHGLHRVQAAGTICGSVKT